MNKDFFINEGREIFSREGVFLGYRKKFKRNKK